MVRGLVISGGDDIWFAPRCHLFVRVELIYVHGRDRMGQYGDSILGSRLAECRYFALASGERKILDP
jgi:hypothetical protein